MLNPVYAGRLSETYYDPEQALEEQFFKGLGRKERKKAREILSKLNPKKRLAALKQIVRLTMNGIEDKKKLNLLVVLCNEEPPETPEQLIDRNLQFAFESVRAAIQHAVTAERLEEDVALSSAAHSVNHLVSAMRSTLEIEKTITNGAETTIEQELEIVLNQGRSVRTIMQETIETMTIKAVAKAKKKMTVIVPTVQGLLKKAEGGATFEALQQVELAACLALRATKAALTLVTRIREKEVANKI